MDAGHERQGAKGEGEGAAVRAAPAQGGTGPAQRAEEGVEGTTRGRGGGGASHRYDHPVEARREAGRGRRAPGPIADQTRAKATLRAHRARRRGLAVLGTRGGGRRRGRGPPRG